MPDRPFFFTSYAVRDADSAMVAEFHTRLEHELEIKRGRSAAPYGFLDRRSLRLGAEWHPELLHAVRTTRLMVALLTDDYFASRWCGREWAVMAERQRRARGAAQGSGPIAIVPLFWVRPQGPLPARAQELMHHTEELGEPYRNSSLVDMVRGDERVYQDFVIRLTDYLLRNSREPLGDLAEQEARDLPAAFGADRADGVGAKAEAAVARPGGAVPDVPGVPGLRPHGIAGRPMSAPGERRAFLGALRQMPVLATRDGYDVWIQAIRERIRPAQLSLLTDGGSPDVRLSALLTSALTHDTPAILLALAETAGEMSPEGDAQARLVMETADKAARNWPPAREG